MILVQQSRNFMRDGINQKISQNFYNWYTRRAAHGVCYYEELFSKIRFLEFAKKYLTNYQSVKDNALTIKLGKTTQSRFQYYNLVNLHQILHYVINISDFD